MSKLLTCIRYAASKIYPPNTNLSAPSTFYVHLTITQAKDLTITKTTHPR